MVDRGYDISDVRPRQIFPFHRQVLKQGWEDRWIESAKLETRDDLYSRSIHSIMFSESGGAEFETVGKTFINSGYSRSWIVVTPLILVLSRLLFPECR